jgi:valyl-tRNA synthetase
MICGFVLAKKGEKLSKSKNNAELSPTTLIEKHSADVVRYWAANSRLGTDTFFSEDELGIARRFVIKLWNAAGFTISRLQDIDRTMDVAWTPIDRWIIERCKQTAFNAARLLEQYETGPARHEIDEFFWKDFCDYYLEIVKERLYQPDIHGNEERKSAQWALYYCMLSILKLYAVYVPHITEHLYQEFFRQHEGCVSLHLMQWETESPLDMEIIRFGEKVRDIVSGARKYKSENSLSMKAEMPEIIIDTEGKYEDWFKKTLKDIQACCRAKTVRVTKGEMLE